MPMMSEKWQANKDEKHAALKKRKGKKEKGKETRARKTMKNDGLYCRALTSDPRFTVSPSFPIRNYNHAFATRAAQLIARHIFKLRLDQMQIVPRHYTYCEINR